jgi:two-component system chemotaxis response regulator CheB
MTPELRAAVLVVIHTGAAEDGLAGVLARSAPLPVLKATDRTTLEPGRVYVAQPNRHLAVQDGIMRVLGGPSQHGFRPAVDVLFLSAARAAGARAAGVILSGALSDGVVGLRAIKMAGGRAVVQNPEEAAFPSMPLNALRDVEVDAVLPALAIAGDLARWAAGSLPRAPKARVRGRGAPHSGERESLPPSSLVPISCPTCNGSLAETRELGVRQYKCHVGHRFNADTLVAMLDGQADSVLWTAVRALQEKALLRRRMHAGATTRTLSELSARWLQEAQEAERQAEQIRQLIERSGPPGAVAIAEQLGKQADRRRPGARKPSRRKTPGKGS